MHSGSSALLLCNIEVLNVDVPTCISDNPHHHVLPLKSRGDKPGCQGDSGTVVWGTSDPVLPVTSLYHISEGSS